MPEPIPTKVLQKIKRQKGLSPAEKLWLGVAIGLTVTALIIAVILACPMPIVLGSICLESVIGDQWSVGE